MSILAQADDLRKRLQEEPSTLIEAWRKDRQGYLATVDLDFRILGYDVTVTLGLRPVEQINGRTYCQRWHGLDVQPGGDVTDIPTFVEDAAMDAAVEYVSGVAR